jgi:hypothetical protein
VRLTPPTRGGQDKDAATAPDGEEAELRRQEDFDEAMDSIAGIVVTHLSGMAARCSNDLAVRRKIGAVVYEVRKMMALAMGDQQGEPPREQQQ